MDLFSMHSQRETSHPVSACLDGGRKGQKQSKNADRCVDLHIAQCCYRAAVTVCLQMHEGVAHITHTEGLWLDAQLMSATPCFALTVHEKSVCLSQSVV